MPACSATCGPNLRRTRIPNSTVNIEMWGRWGFKWGPKLSPKKWEHGSWPQLNQLRTNCWRVNNVEPIRALLLKMGRSCLWSPKSTAWCANLAKVNKHNASGSGAWPASSITSWRIWGASWEAEKSHGLVFDVFVPCFHHHPKNDFDSCQ